MNERVGELRSVALGPDGTALIGAEVSVLVAAPIRDERARRLWSTVQHGGGLDDVVAVLGLEDPSSLPAMAVVGLSSDRALVLVLVRGDMSVALTTEDGPTYLGTPVQTWSEHPWEGPADLHVGVPGLAGGSTVGPDSAEVAVGLVPARALGLPLHPEPGARLGLGPLVAQDPLVGAPPAPLADPAPVDAPYAPEPGDETVLAPVPPAPPSESDGAATGIRPLIGSPPPALPDEGPAETPTAPEATPTGGPADHDGRTITAEEVRRILGSPSRGGGSSLAPVVSGSSYMAVRCSVGHLNPVHGHRCRACGDPLAQSVPELVADLVLGSFHFSTGQVVAVDRPMLIGRSPVASGEVRGRIPELIAVPSPDHDISRTHLEVRLEGWQVLVIDRDSTNGTTVELPGREPQRLRPGHPFPLPVGAGVSLAGEVDFTFEVGR